MNKQKQDQEKHNPCLKEQNLTYRCLDKNAYDKDKCELQMNNYNLCKSFWVCFKMSACDFSTSPEAICCLKDDGKGQIRKQRRQNGITPYLPEPSEREKIKAEFFEQFVKTSG